MSTILNSFFMAQLWIRIVIVLFIFLILWKILGKKLLWILSIIPYILQKIFMVLYQVIELPIAAAHKASGGIFYELDNKLAKHGGKVDNKLKEWYQCWHSQYEFHLGRALLICLICFVWIMGPTFVSSNNAVLNVGLHTYMTFEEKLVEYIETHISNDLELQRSKSFGQNSEGKNTQMEMIVSGKSKSLAVRDKANIKKGKVLQKLKKGDKVIWNGNLVFAKVKDEHIEAWVQIETKKGVKGWTRLFYLYPKNYKEQQFFVVERE